MAIINLFRMFCTHIRRKKYEKFILIIILIVLGGCTSLPKPVPFTMDIPENQKIGILTAKPEEAYANFVGSIGLLELPVIMTVNASLRAHLKSLKFDDDFSILPKRVKTIIGKNKSVEIVNEYIPDDFSFKLKDHENGISQNDYSIYKEKYGFDYLLLLRAQEIGITRPYYSIMPTAPPTANASIWGELVDLSNKKVLWYRRVSVAQLVIPEPWDEKESGFANLTNSIYTALNQAMDKIVSDLRYPKEGSGRD